MKPRAADFLLRAKMAGLDLLVTCTLRYKAEQAILYAQGRTTPGKIVTWAKPGESWHQSGDAIDVVPMRAGKCVWGTTGADGAMWRAVGAMGEAAGLEWAGRWPAKSREYQHFQYREKQ